MAHEASYFQELGGAKTQLTLHRPNRILFGLFYRCDDPGCREFTRERGCTARQRSLGVFLALADPVERQAAVDAGYLILEIEKDTVLFSDPTAQDIPAVVSPAPAVSFRATAAIPRFPEAAVRATSDFGPAPRPVPPPSVARPLPVRAAAAS
jgi:hypothetical protein